MTIAHLLVRLSAETAEFHQEMERAARRVEKTGKVFTKIGREISMAISLPLIAGAFGAFHVLLAESARQFGPLFQAVESLKAELHDLFLAIAHELAPTFEQIIGLLRGGIGILHSWVAAFHDLPEPLRKAVIFALAFLAALGPTLFVVGKLITAIGALGRILPLLVTPLGLAVVAVAALAAAAIYVVTHWDWAKLQLALAWAFIVDLFFQGVRANLLALDILTLGITKIAGVTDFLRAKLDALADRTLGTLGAKILELEGNLKHATGPAADLGTQSLKIRKIFQDWAEATRQLSIDVNILGPTFNAFAANAQNLATVYAALKSAGVGLDVVLNKNGDTLRSIGQNLQDAQERARAFGLALGAFGPDLENQVRAAARFKEIIESLGGTALTENLVKAAKIISREGQLMIDASNAIRDGVGSAFGALGEQLGSIFAGMAHGFRGFGKTIAGVLGGMLKTVGQALIAFGIAGDAIKKFITNPFAAIAAGVALIALGSVLAASAAGAVSAGGNALAAGGGGGGGVATTSAVAPAEDQGTLILRLDSNFRRLNPEFVDIIAQALQEAKSRNVIIEESD